MPPKLRSDEKAGAGAGAEAKPPEGVDPNFHMMMQLMQKMEQTRREDMQAMEDARRDDSGLWTRPAGYGRGSTR